MINWTPIFFISQLHDWVQVNKKAVHDLLKEQDTAKTDIVTTEQFFSTLEGVGVPLDSDNKGKLLAIYDKKGEGKLNYSDFIAEQKFVHAVRGHCICVYASWISTHVYSASVLDDLFLIHVHLFCSLTNLVQKMTSRLKLKRERRARKEEGRKERYAYDV